MLAGVQTRYDPRTVRSQVDEVVHGGPLSTVIDMWTCACLSRFSVGWAGSTADADQHRRPYSRLPLMEYRGTIHISVCGNAIGSWSVGVSVGGWELEHSQFSMSSSGREKRLRSGPAGLIMRKITYIIQTLWRGSNHSAKACSTHHSSLKRSEGRYLWASKATRA